MLVSDPFTHLTIKIKSNKSEKASFEIDESNDVEYRYTYLPNSDIYGNLLGIHGKLDGYYFNQEDFAALRNFSAKISHICGKDEIIYSGKEPEIDSTYSFTDDESILLNLEEYDSFKIKIDETAAEYLKLVEKGYISYFIEEYITMQKGTIIIKNSRSITIDPRVAYSENDEYWYTRVSETNPCVCLIKFRVFKTYGTEVVRSEHPLKQTCSNLIKEAPIFSKKQNFTNKDMLLLQSLGMSANSIGRLQEITTTFKVTISDQANNQKKNSEININWQPIIEKIQRCFNSKDLSMVRQIEKDAIGMIKEKLNDSQLTKIELLFLKKGDRLERVEVLPIASLLVSNAELTVVTCSVREKMKERISELHEGSREANKIKQYMDKRQW